MGGRRIGAVDTLWLNMDRPVNLMVIESLVLLEEVPDRDRLLDLLRERLVDRFPVFSQRPRGGLVPGGRPTWQDDPDFMLEDHVRWVRVPAPGDVAVLQRYVGRYAGVPLPHDRPMWEMHIVEGLSEGAAVFSRLHHALADGVSLMQVLLSLTDPDPDPDPTGRGEEQQAWGSERHPLVPDGRKVLEHAAVLPRLLTPAGARHGVETAAKLGRAAGKLLLTRNPPTTVRARPGTFKKVVWSPPLPLQAVKDVAQETGTTVNDVLVATLSGAVHRYLVAAGDRPVDVPTMVPVNIRPLDVPLPRELGNRFALVLLSLPSGLDTPFARLAETQRRMDRIKQSPEAALTFELIRGIGMTGRLLERPLVDFFANKATGVTTNVPGPRETRYLAGARVTGLLGWAPESGDQTLGTSLITYAGTLRVGFKVDAAAIPQPQRLLEAFLAEHDALLGQLAPA